MYACARSYAPEPAESQRLEAANTKAAVAMMVAKGGRPGFQEGLFHCGGALCTGVGCSLSSRVSSPSLS